MSRGPRWLIVLAAVVLTSASQADSPDKGLLDPAAAQRPDHGHSPVCQQSADKGLLDPSAAQRKAADTVLYNTLRDVINRGVELYNAGDPAGCYRLYEGSLRTIAPLLEHHPKLPKIIKEYLARAEGDSYTWRRAFTLRAALDKVRETINPNPPPEKLPRPRVELDDQADKPER